MSVISFTAISISSLGFRIFLLSVSRNAPWTSRLLLLFLLFPCILSFSAFSGRRTLLLHFPRCSLPRTPVSPVLITAVPTILLLVPAHLLPAEFLPLFLQLLLFFFLLFVISCYIWLILFSFPLNHGFVLFSSKPHTSSATLVSIFAIQSQLVTFSFSHPFWCVLVL